MPDVSTDDQLKTDEGTESARFLARRGVVLVKEFRPVGKFLGQRGELLAFETLSLKVVSGNSKKCSYGMKVDLYDSEDNFDSSVCLDFDELDEFLQAIVFFQATARDLLVQKRDHTEVSYSTKDDARVGFYQKSGEQTAFLALPGGSNTVFFPVEELSDIVNYISKAKEHLLSCGASPNQFAVD